MGDALHGQRKGIEFWLFVGRALFFDGLSTARNGHLYSHARALFHWVKYSQTSQRHGSGPQSDKIKTEAEGKIGGDGKSTMPKATKARGWPKSAAGNWVFRRDVCSFRKKLLAPWERNRTHSQRENVKKSGAGYLKPLFLSRFLMCSAQCLYHEHCYFWKCVKQMLGNCNSPVKRPHGRVTWVYSGQVPDRNQLPRHHMTNHFTQ